MSKSKEIQPPISCEKCKKKLYGKMLFFPKLCLSCVIDMYINKS